MVTVFLAQTGGKGIAQDLYQWSVEFVNLPLAGFVVFIGLAILLLDRTDLKKKQKHKDAKISTVLGIAYVVGGLILGIWLLISS